MANEFVLDTHALVWFVGGNSRLGANARAVMQDPVNVLYLPINSPGRRPLYSSIC
jgi:PIN domain nuclease of toxin-antitoxin system